MRCFTFFEGTRKTIKIKYGIIGNINLIPWFKGINKYINKIKDSDKNTIIFFSDTKVLNKILIFILFKKNQKKQTTIKRIWMILSKKLYSKNLKLWNKGLKKYSIIIDR